MRVLCTCLPEYGHFHPLVPLARALVAAGHDLAFATAPEFCPRVEQAGFGAFPAGLGFGEQMEEARRRYPGEAALPAGQRRFVAFVPRMLAGVAAPARAADLVPIVRRWKPDVVVHGEAELAGPVVADLAGVPYATQSVCLLRPLEMARVAEDVLHSWCGPWGFDMGGLFRYLYLDVCPPRLQSPEIDEVAVAHLADAEGKPLSHRPGGAAAYDAAARERLPAWLGNLPDLPTVYVTLGTLNQDRDAYRLILDGLGDEPVNVVVTVGNDGDPEAVGAASPNTHVERYIPQSLLLPHCDVVVNHAGSILPVLGHGLPLVMVPHKGNEFHNAQACVDVGVGRRLLRRDLSPATVRREVRALLEDASYRQRAGRIAEDIKRMPGPEHAAGLVERLAREGRPLVGEPRWAGLGAP